MSQNPVSDIIKKTICHQFYDICRSDLSKYKYVLLDFYPKNPDHNDTRPFLVIPEGDGTLQIIFFKQTLLKMFVESHNFSKNSPMRGVGNVTSLEKYIMTLGFLITTPQNHTYLKYHQECLLELLSSYPNMLNTEFIFVGLLLSSTNKKLNKSSAMWLYYKRLLILKKHLGHYSDLAEIFENIFLKSASNHFSNYYCWNTVRWLFDNETELSQKILIYNQIFDFCKNHVTDCSSWSALAYILRQSHTNMRETYNIQEYQRLETSLHLLDSIETHKTNKKNNWLDQYVVDSAFEQVTSLIDKFELGSQPAFDFIIALAPATNTLLVKKQLTCWNSILEINKHILNIDINSDDLILLKKTEYLHQVRNVTKSLEKNSETTAI